MPDLTLVCSFVCPQCPFQSPPVQASRLSTPLPTSSATLVTLTCVDLTPLTLALRPPYGQGVWLPLLQPSSLTHVNLCMFLCPCCPTPPLAGQGVWLPLHQPLLLSERQLLRQRHRGIRHHRAHRGRLRGKQPAEEGGEKGFDCVSSASWGRVRGVPMQ